MPQRVPAGHEIIAGAIGSGKSYWAVYKNVMSMVYGIPTCYIDPKGDTFAAIIRFLSSTSQGQDLWEQLKDRILFLNPVSTGTHLLGFNAIDPMEEFDEYAPDYLALLANSLTSHIRNQSGFDTGEAMRMQNIMAAAIGILAEGGHGTMTLAELPLLYVPTYRPTGRNKRVLEPVNPFVRSLLESCDHHGVNTFWKDQWPTWTPNSRRDWVQSTEGRIFRYLFDERLLMTVCATDTARLDLRKVVDEGYWLFVNLPYALLSDTVTTLLGNLIATRIFYAAMRRPPGSSPYRLILDEARFFNTGPLDVILETSRAYNLWLTLIVQSLDQMCRSRNGRLDEHLMHTAINNARYFSVFQNVSDNELLARLMYPISGQVITGYNWNLDSFEYLPVAAEVNAHERRFMNLRPREVVLWDKMGTEGPQVWRTPDVIMDEPDFAWEREFENKHLAETGAPIESIRAETAERQRRIREMLAGTEPSSSRRTSQRMRPGGTL